MVAVCYNHYSRRVSNIRRSRSVGGNHVDPIFLHIHFCILVNFIAQVIACNFIKEQL